MKRALITGVGGQDGSYLAEYLVLMGYDVHGMMRLDPRARETLSNVWDKMMFHFGDMRDVESLEHILRRVQPDEIYNLAGQTFVPTSWSLPDVTFEVNSGAFSNILMYAEKICPQVRIYQASTSEMFGNMAMIPAIIEPHDHKPMLLTKLSEESPMRPVSPYAISKFASHNMCRMARERGMYVVSGIAFNHESPRRDHCMVTRKIVQHVALWAQGFKTPLQLGNIYAMRDWGFAGDYVQAMHMMLQQPEADDYVIGTGEAHSVWEFLRESVHAAGMDWTDIQIREHLKTNVKEFTRENEVHCLVADPSKAERVLGWRPQTSFSQLVQLMMDAELSRFTQRYNNTPATELSSKVQ